MPHRPANPCLKIIEGPIDEDCFLLSATPIIASLGEVHRSRGPNFLLPFSVRHFERKDSRIIP